MSASTDPSVPARPAPIDPRSFAERAFATSRRGFEPDEVRAHLRIAADHISALQDHVAELESRLRAAQTPSPASPPRELDVQQVATLVGEETARVLETAREAAAEIKAKAEENATRLLRDAHEEATQSKASADEYAARLRRESEEEATATRSNADRYAAELRRATDAEVEEMRARAAAEVDEVRRGTEAHMAELRTEADDHVARVRAEADDYATSTRGAADDELLRLREEGQAEADRLRAEADAAALAVRDEAEQVLHLRSEEANAEASRIVGDAHAERERIQASAEGVLDRAREEADRLLREAEAARERVLHDLSRRRKQAKAHLEQLEAARARLLSAYEVVRTTVDDATHELHAVLPEARAAASDALNRAMAEPEEPVAHLEAELRTARDLELPLVQEGPPSPDDAAGPPAAGAGPWAAPDHVGDAVPTGPGEAPEAEGDRHHAPADDAADPGGEPADAGGEPADAGDGEGEGEGHDRRRGLFGRRRREPLHAEPGVILSSADASPVGSAPGPEAPAPDPATRVVDVAGSASTVVAEAAAPAAVRGGAEPSAPPGNPAIGDLFARIRASQDDDASDEAEGEAAARTPAAVAGAPAAAPVEPHEAGGEEPSDQEGAEGDDADEEGEPDPAPVAWRKRRDASLAGFEKRLARRLKRTLADEESELLDQLRTVKGRPKPDKVLPPHDDVLHKYTDAATPLLREAAAEGAANVADIGAGDPPAGRSATDISALAGELASELVELLRPRVERVIDDAAGGDDPIDELELADQVRACYREWRTQRLGDLVRHSVLAAFTRGLYDSVPGGVELTWVIDDTAHPCPDCADNVLAGGVTRGDPFPTEHVCPPAHPGCRCFVFVDPQ
ncbi:MAG TPA: DivIVA domain-containing protein [Acidimicrobiales bacterium]|nr:DivIVA domain-containing protein [Acidimicrobiales bacterium]